MKLFEVIKEFIDIDNQVKTVGMIITVANNRVSKLISQGYIVPLPSIIAESFLKQIRDIGIQILAETNETNDKLGENTDFWGGSTKTALAYSNSAYKHIHNPSYVYPDDCTLVNAITSATVDIFGEFAELVPENGIPVNFDIHWANIQDINANGTYIVEIHEVSNADLQVSEKYLGGFSVSRQNNFTRSFQVYTQIPVVHANTRIGIRAKKGDAGAGTVSLNVSYHDYE